MSEIDLSEFKVRRVQARRVFAAQVGAAVRMGIRAGVERAQTVHIHTRQTGHLTDSVEGHVTKSDDGGTEGYLENSASYAPFVEYGTSAHLIRPIDYEDAIGGKAARHTSGKRAGRFVKNPTFGVGRGKYLRFYVGGAVVFAREVQHPGTPAMPFMAPASEYAGMVIVELIETKACVALAAVWED